MSAGYFRTIKSDNMFTIIVKTDNPGVSDDDQFQFTGAQGSYDVIATDIVTGEKEVFVNLVDQETIVFSGGAGTYMLQIRPRKDNPFHRIRFTSSTDNEKLIEIKRWGRVKWSSMERSFNNCFEMDLSATDSPNLTDAISCDMMFSGCIALSGGNFDWDVSNIEDFNRMFQFCQNFNNIDIINWDTSAAVNMGFMFAGAGSFNQPIGNWNTSNVENISSMFSSTIFNQDINDWDVSNVTNMNSLFSANIYFNQPLSSWNVGNVTNIENMFYNAWAFNQDISGWNVGNVTNMSRMFQAAKAFNQDISGWNVTNVETAVNFMINKLPASFSVDNLDNIYNTWSLLTLKPNVSIRFSVLQYSLESQAGRDILTGAPNNWTIVDGGLVD